MAEAKKVNFNKLLLYQNYLDKLGGNMGPNPRSAQARLGDLGELALILRDPNCDSSMRNRAMSLSESLSSLFLNPRALPLGEEEMKPALKEFVKLLKASKSPLDSNLLAGTVAHLVSRRPSLISLFFSEYGVNMDEKTVSKFSFSNCVYAWDDITHFAEFIGKHPGDEGKEMLIALKSSYPMSHFWYSPKFLEHLYENRNLKKTEKPVIFVVSSYGCGAEPKILDKLVDAGFIIRFAEARTNADCKAELKKLRGKNGGPADAIMISMHGWEEGASFHNANDPKARFFDQRDGFNDGDVDIFSEINKSVKKDGIVIFAACSVGKRSDPRNLAKVLSENIHAQVRAPNEGSSLKDIKIQKIKGKPVITDVFFSNYGKPGMDTAWRKGKEIQLAR